MYTSSCVRVYFPSDRHHNPYPHINSPATHGEEIQSPLRSAQAIMALVLNYKRIKKVGAGPIARHGWEKPPEDFVKLDVDAAFDIDTGSGGTGAIFRD